MRTLAWLVPFPLEFYLIDWAYNTESDDFLGLAFIGLVVINIAILVWAVANDWQEFQTDRANREENE